MFSVVRTRGDYIVITKSGQVRVSKDAVHKVLLVATVLGIAAVMAGCAGLMGGSATQLSADQMKAMANDKNATAFCGIASGPWGKVITTYAVVDNKVITEGGFAVDDTCKVQFLNSRPQVIVQQPQQQVVGPTLPTVPSQFTPSIR